MLSAARLCVQVVLSVAEHHSNLVPWQMVAQKTGAALKHVRLTPDTQELDMQVRGTDRVRDLTMYMEGLATHTDMSAAAASWCAAAAQPPRTIFGSSCPAGHALAFQADSCVPGVQHHIVLVCVICCVPLHLPAVLTALS